MSIYQCLTRCCIVPQRYVISLMCLAGIACGFIMRMSFNQALTTMVKNPLENYTDVEEMELEDWDQSTQGYLLGSFYWGYVLSQIPAGMMADKYGGKYVLGVTVFLYGSVFAIHPLIIETGILPLLFLMRVLCGFFNGPCLPSVSNIVSHWIPLRERGISFGIIGGGGIVGSSVGTMLTGFILTRMDWSSVFYIWSTVTSFWCICWIMFGYSNPYVHPFIRPEELSYLKEHLSPNRKLVRSIPWKEILTSTPCWALILAACGHNWLIFLYISDFPKYFTEVLLYPPDQTGIILSSGFISLWGCSIIFGTLCDYLNRNNRLSVLSTRKIMVTIAFTPTAVLVVLIPYSVDNKPLLIFLFVVTNMLHAGSMALALNLMDLCPDYTGSLGSLVNTLGSLVGMIVPHFVGIMTHNGTNDEWKSVFWISGIFLLVSNVIYIAFADSKIQVWAEVDESEAM